MKRHRSALVRQQLLDGVEGPISQQVEHLSSGLIPAASGQHDACHGSGKGIIAANRAASCLLAPILQPLCSHLLVQERPDSSCERG